MSDLLISRFLPAESLREVDHVAVAALPERAWCVARAVDLARMPFVRWLSEARILPDCIAAFLRGRQQPVLESIGVASIERNHGPGFMLLGEEPGREVVVGAVGPFWRPRIEWAEVKPETFAAFNEPGWARLRVAKARRWATSTTGSTPWSGRSRSAPVVSECTCRRSVSLLNGPSPTATS